MFVAIIAMNGAAVFLTGMVSSYRVLDEGGFALADYILIRNIIALLVSSIWCAVYRINVWKTFPSENK